MSVALRYIVVFLLVCMSGRYVCAQSIKVMGPRNADDPGHQYFLDLTQFLFEKTAHLYPSSQLDVVNAEALTQGRIFRFLNDGTLDIVWAGTSLQREENYSPIFVPILRGLLGHRVLIVHKEYAEYFNQISLNALKNKVACQGEHWPDSDILEDNGFTVARMGQYDSMFKMVQLKRCDYFPRGIHEGQKEVAALKPRFDALEVVESVQLKYNLPVYYFVKKGNFALSQRLYTALKMGLHDGSLEAFKKSHAVTASTYKPNDPRVKIFMLNNRNTTHNWKIKAIEGNQVETPSG